MKRIFPRILWFDIIFIQLLVCFLSPCQGLGIKTHKRWIKIILNCKPWEILYISNGYGEQRHKSLQYYNIWCIKLQHITLKTRPKCSIRICSLHINLFAITIYHWTICCVICFIRFVKLAFPYYLWQQVIPNKSSWRVWPVSRGCLLRYDILSNLCFC
jgi:hypothetical protein